MRINVRVKPNSGRVEVLNKGDYYLVCLKKPAREGKANFELLKVLKNYFGKSVEIVRGFHGRKKVVEVID